MDNEEYDIRNAAAESDKDYERALRPNRFESFAGQDKIVSNLKVFVQAARMRGHRISQYMLKYYSTRFLRRQTLFAENFPQICMPRT